MTQKPQSSMINPGPGFRIRPEICRPAQELSAAFQEFETPDISDMLNRIYTMSPAIKNLTHNEHIVGPACTVKVYPGDNLMVHKALDIVKPGDIIVVDTCGSMQNGIIGDLIATKARHRGVRGFIIDGLVRDIPGVREVGMPVFARGITPQGPLHRGPGEINFPIACGGIVVNPGDLICADDNGVVVAPREFAFPLLQRLREKKDQLEAYIAAVQRGVFSNGWVDQILEMAHCEFVD